MEFLREYGRFLRQRKKLWLLPLLFTLLLAATLVMAAKGAAVSPFIYALF